MGGVFLYYNKVEISGVNTAKLKVLKESEKTELLRQMRSGDPTAREKLINGNLRLVLSVIQRFSGRGENPDDLFQVGCIGLMKAIDNFSTDFNVRFSTYAVPMIMGELRRYLRDSGSIRVSRSMRDLAYKAMQAREKLTNDNSKEPTIEQIAKEIDAKREDVVIALEAVSDPISLYEPVFSESGDTIYMMDQIGDNNDDRNWLDEIALKEAIIGLDEDWGQDIAISDAMGHLIEREKKILRMRFFEGRTQMEVAGEIGISQAQVSRLEKGALGKIKKAL